MPNSVKTKMLPGISVIVTTYNWPLALDKVLSHLHAQTYPKVEIIVADDGSTATTKIVVDCWKAKSSHPIEHVWQPDQGFQAGKIRNKAVAKAKYDYLIFIDGDCLIQPNFILRHANLRQQGTFVAGNRILLSKSYTEKFLDNERFLSNAILYWFFLGLFKQCNRYLPLLYYPWNIGRLWSAKSWHNVKTCNLAMYKKDFIAANGFDENFKGWGLEDSDLVIRLLNLNLKRKSGKFSVPVFHLYHPEQPRNTFEQNRKLLETTILERNTQAKCGIAQYL